MKTYQGLIGKRAFIKDRNSYWGGFWGYVKSAGEEGIVLGGGAIGSGSYPMFSRSDLRIVTEKQK